MRSGLPTRRELAAMFAVALAILVLQIALSRLLSVVLWYHFAFVAISLAMLGLSLGGVALYLWPPLRVHAPGLLPWYCRVGAVSTLAGLYWSVGGSGPDTSAGGVLNGTLVAFYAILLVPFTCAGLAVSSLLALYVQGISRLYAWDLAGAAIGCAAAVPLLDVLGAPGAIIVAAACLAAGGLCIAHGARRWIDVVLLAALAALCAAQQAGSLLEPSAMHGIPDEDPAAGRIREFSGWNSHSRVVVTRESDWIKTINIDGHATTGLYRMDVQATQDSVRRQMPWLDLLAGALPFVALDRPARMLSIGPGGGLDLLNGIHHGATIQGVELNGLIHGLVQGRFSSWAGNVYRAPGVDVVHDEARSWIRRSNASFDLIQASMIDTWAATAGGAFALAENSLYTVEAFVDYWDHLTPDGVVHFLRWHEDPPRQSFRLLTLVVQAMRARGIATDPGRHVVVLEEPSFPASAMPMASVLWSKSEFDPQRLQRIRAFVDERAQLGRVRVVHWPGETHDNVLSAYLRSGTDDVVDTYEFDVSPTTDDRPFFFHTRRLRDLLAVNGPEVANEQALSVLISVLLIVLVLTCAVFVVPMLRQVRASGAAGRAWTAGSIGYFCCLGFGFMFVEIPLLQRFTLFVGHPAWALSTVLGALLLGAGAGGAFTGRVPAAHEARAVRVVLGVILAVLAAAMAGTPLLTATALDWSFGGRVAVTGAVMFAIGFPLGCALPLGMRSTYRRDEDLAPWAWGMNGAASVLGSTLAVVLGMQLGFSATLVCGWLCYCGALLLAVICMRPAGAAPQLTSRAS